MTLLHVMYLIKVVVDTHNLITMKNKGC